MDVPEWGMELKQQKIAQGKKICKENYNRSCSFRHFISNPYNLRKISLYMDKISWARLNYFHYCEVVLCVSAILM